MRGDSADSLISIITPTRNYGKYLSSALASVEAQGDGNVEHIVVDGASTDDTTRLLEGWAAPRFAWISEPDAGQSDALNKGRRMAKGEWLGWLNADEFYLPWTFTHWRRALTKYPEADVFFGDVVWVDATGRVMRLLPQHAFDDRLTRWYGCYVATCTALVRSSVVPGDFLDPTLRRWMDWDFWMRMAQDGARFVHLRSPLGAFAVHEAAITYASASLTDPELTRIRRRHAIPTAASAATALRAAARLEHMVRKGANGGYLKQMRVSGLLGHRLDWWCDEAGRDTAAALHAACCSLCRYGSWRR